MPLLLQNWVLAIPTLIDRKPVQKKWIGEKCGFFQPLVSSMAQRKVSISRHSALSEWLEHLSVLFCFPVNVPTLNRFHGVWLSSALISLEIMLLRPKAYKIFNSFLNKVGQEPIVSSRRYTQVEVSKEFCVDYWKVQVTSHNGSGP